MSDTLIQPQGVHEMIVVIAKPQTFLIMTLVILEKNMNIRLDNIGRSSSPRKHATVESKVS